jgi:nitrous oxidase accessory protein
MGGIHKRKPYAILLAGIFLLSVAFMIQPLEGKSIVDTIVVDDGGSADYETIGDALDAAQNGDHIIVRSGLYQEQNLIIDKTLTLVGEEAATTIVQGDGSQKLCIIRADEVMISNFTFTGGGGEIIGSNIDISANNCIISHNIITNNDDVGISIHHSSDVIIKNNVITFCPFAGIRNYENTDSNIMKNNQIDECISGIYVHDSMNQLIQDNTISNCSKGIYLEECQNNNVKYNLLTNNAQGMFVSYS